MGELLIDLYIVSILLSWTSYYTTFLKIMVEVKAFWPPHALGQWWGVSKFMHSKKSSFSVSAISWRSQSCHKVEVSLAISVLGILPDLMQSCLPVYALLDGGAHVVLQDAAFSPLRDSFLFTFLARFGGVYCLTVYPMSHNL